MLEALLLIFGAITLVAVALLYGTFAWGFVLYKFWYWFLLPVFPILPHVTILQCVGIFFIIGLFHTPPSQYLKDDYVDKSKAYVNIFLPPLALLFGWLFKIIFY